MSGHSKWSTIKRHKADVDNKRGALFNKLIRELVVTAKEGGADISTNFALASAVSKAKAGNMPKDTMEKAIKRGAGGGSGEIYERLTYEGRGPAGTAMIIQTLTDNKNRTVADIRHIFSKHGGTMGEAVTWMFERKGLLTLKGTYDEDDLLEACMDAGADNYKVEGENTEVFCAPEDLNDVVAWFKGNDRYEVAETDLAMLAKEEIEITSESGAKKVLRILDAFDDNDDVQAVYSNWSMSDELIEAISG